jgi:hypothetical protein
MWRGLPAAELRQDAPATYRSYFLGDPYGSGTSNFNFVDSVGRDETARSKIEV